MRKRVRGRVIARFEFTYRDSSNVRGLDGCGNASRWYEREALNYTSTYDADEDGISDGQEYNGYNITIVWIDGDETKSKDKRIYGDPLLLYKDENGNLLDVDEDGIPDYIEADPYNVTDNETIEEYVKTHNETCIENQFLDP